MSRMFMAPSANSALRTLKPMELARKAAEDSTCQRRQIGAVFVDREGFYVTGHNGPDYSCFDHPCPTANEPAGSGAGCHGKHAEIRALEKWPKDKEIYAVYSTKMPCATCVEELLRTPCELIIYDTPSNDKTGMTRWIVEGRSLLHS